MVSRDDIVGDGHFGLKLFISVDGSVVIQLLGRVKDWQLLGVQDIVHC